MVEGNLGSGTSKNFATNCAMCLQLVVPIWVGPTGLISVAFLLNKALLGCRM